MKSFSKCLLLFFVAFSLNAGLLKAQEPQEMLGEIKDDEKLDTYLFATPKAAFEIIETIKVDYQQMPYNKISLHQLLEAMNYRLLRAQKENTKVDAIFTEDGKNWHLVAYEEESGKRFAHISRINNISGLDIFAGTLPLKIGEYVGVAEGVDLEKIDLSKSNPYRALKKQISNAASNLKEQGDALVFAKGKLMVYKYAD